MEKGSSLFISLSYLRDKIIDSQKDLPDSENKTCEYSSWGVTYVTGVR